MREILFRGKTKNELPSRWVFGSLTDIGHKWFIDDYQDNSRVITETIGQYIGLKDKNGTKIFEGDIVRILYTDWASKSENDTRTLDEYLRDIAKIGVVEWDKYYPQFHIHFIDKDNYNSLNYGRYGYIEVIGNIHDNPELIHQHEDKGE